MENYRQNKEKKDNFVHPVTRCGTVPSFDHSFKFFGPTYFDEGLMTSTGYLHNSSHPEESTTTNVKFYGDVYSAGTFKSIAAAVKMNFDDPDPIASYTSENLKYDNFTNEIIGIELVNPY